MTIEQQHIIESALHNADRLAKAAFTVLGSSASLHGIDDAEIVGTLVEKIRDDCLAALNVLDKSAQDNT